MRRTAAVFLLSLALAVSAGRATAAEQSLQSAEAVHETVPREDLFDAVIEAVHQATVSARIAGTVVEVNFDVDDYVEKDEVILRFRDREQRAAVDSARARFEEARAEYRRMKEVFERGLVAKSAFDKAVAAFESAKAE